MSNLGVGIIGCGNISIAYLELAPLFKGIEVRAVADINHAAAAQKAEEFNVRAESIEGLLGAGDIEVVVNLTIPNSHFEVTKKILSAGKHAYTEKPMVLSLADGQDLAALSKAQNCRIGSAPDTFLGGAHQKARAFLDEGVIGDIVAGTAHVMSHGMEHWHPNPDFFFLPGAGPMLDVGPYYVTNLVQLLGPVKRVAALATSASDTRTILSEMRKGEKIPVKTPTNIHALLEFGTGATITLSTSWDVWAHRHPNMELYGSEGSLYVPDPNFFGGDVEVLGKDGEAQNMTPYEHPFAVLNKYDNGQMQANYRAAGVADMVAAISQDRPHRCSMELALHTVDVMTGILRSGEEGWFVDMQTTCARPAPLTPEEAQALII